VPSVDSTSVLAGRTVLLVQLIRRLFTTALMFLWATGFSANATPNKTVIIRDDRGGGVIERARLIEAYQANGTRIEIRGNYCLSACTMFLRLSETCIMPTTRFGFHGPSSPVYGIALSSASFDQWSRVMAAHYPEPLRSWFMEEGRQRIVGFHEFSGRQLINMGISRCEN